MTAKRKRSILCALAFVAVVLTGYAMTQKIVESYTGAAQATQQAVTLFDTPTLRVELEGAETRVFDLVGGKEYSYTTKRKRVSKNPTLEQMHGEHFRKYRHGENRACGRAYCDK